MLLSHLIQCHKVDVGRSYLTLTGCPCHERYRANIPTINLD